MSVCISSVFITPGETLSSCNLLHPAVSLFKMILCLVFAPCGPVSGLTSSCTHRPRLWPFPVGLTAI